VRSRLVDVPVALLEHAPVRPPTTTEPGADHGLS